MRIEPAKVNGRVIDCAWITGAGKGIGRAVALRLAKSGVKVAVSARTAADLESLAQEAELFGGRILPVALDVTDAAALEEAADHIEAALGPIDLAIFNAGSHKEMDPASFDTAIFRELMDLNFMGTVNGIQAVIDRFRDRRRGQIAVVASIAGYRGLPTAAAYGATKAALINMCEALEPDLRRMGIGITLINPGFVRTPLTDQNDFPMPFLMEVDAAAERITRGLAKGRFEVTFPKRFTWLLKIVRCLPYWLYLPLVRWSTRR
ncbi:MAG: SDR family NAD(P)-dependent oxidoreductase [Proteobacteria bacterium]|nr:SDR family NAD(P)-dependent oxidoreductase [Pseudomonadota bacterium]